MRRILLLALCLPALRVTALTLVDAGRPQATIVMAADAADKAKLAADELRDYLRKLSGATLPIATDADKPTGTLVLVGPSAMAKQLVPDLPAGLTPARREEGYAVVCRGDRLVLAGNDAGPYHGTEYAVYRLLRDLGVRWFMPGDYGEYVPAMPTVTVAAGRRIERPDFVMRNWWLHAPPELLALEKRWKIRNGMNPESLFATPGDSSARNILPEGKYFKEHPEYFALNADGTRNPYLPNLTSPEAVGIAAGIIKDRFREHPEETSFGFAPDDGLPRDWNPETLKRSAGFTSTSGRTGVPAEMACSEEWFGFVNRVAAEVRKEFPAAYLATNGYANRDLPPQGTTLDDHLVVMYAAIWSCTLHAYDDDHCFQKERQGDMLQRWCRMCRNVWIYGYNYQMLVSGLTPLPETHKLKRDFPLMKKWGVMGFLDETRNVWAECGIASRYLRAQLEWDAGADAEALLRDFYQHWYGAAAVEMRAYGEALEDAIEHSPYHGHEDRVVPYLYTPQLLAELDRRLAAAERLAADERSKLHLRADRLIHDHLHAYMAMSQAEWEGDYGRAAQHADKMLQLRTPLHAIDSFYIQPDESGYDTGVWYWTITNRRDYYRKLAARQRVALLPRTAAFRLDPHDDGMWAGWEQPGLREDGWEKVDVAVPFYAQGHQDERGHPYTGYAWYRFAVDVPASAKGKRVVLHAPVVETEAWVWVNGRYVGYRPYLEAYIRPAAMELDVTDALKPGARNTVAIRVNTGLFAAQAAAGLQSRLDLTVAP